MFRQLFERVHSIKAFFAKILLGIGLACFLAGQLFMTIYPILQRDLPIEPDDAYAYIVKAPQIEDCLLQDCKSLASLRDTLLVPAESYPLAFHRWTALARTHGFSIPLYVLSLEAIHRTGVSYEIAYSILSILGIVVICVGTAFLLLAFFSPGAVGTTLLLLSIVTFRGQGIHSIVPSNFALGIALCIWAYLYSKINYRPWLVFASMITMALIHPIGAVLNVITLAIYTTQHLVNRKKLGEWRLWFILSLGVVVVGAEFILPGLVKYPMYYSTDPPVPQDFSFFGGFITNLTAAGLNVSILIRAFFHPFFFLVLLLSGFLWLNREKTIRLAVALLTIAAALIVSLFYVTTIPGLLFERLWIVLAFLLLGIIGNGIFSVLTFAFDWTSRRSFPSLQFPSLRTPFTNQAWVFLAIVFFLIPCGLYGYMGYYGRSYAINLDNKIERGNDSYDIRQVELLVQTSSLNGVVVYGGLEPMLYFITHGALHVNSLYAPALIGSSLEQEYLAQNDDIDLLVTSQPLLTSQWGEKGAVVLNSATTLELDFNQGSPPNEIWFLFEDTAHASSLTIYQGETSRLLEIPEGDSGWLPVSLTGKIDPIRLDLGSLKSTLRLNGLRLSASQMTYWPWDQGSVTRITEGSISFEYAFSPESLFPYLNSDLTVLADQGTTVLLEVKWPQAQ